MSRVVISKSNIQKIPNKWSDLIIINDKLIEPTVGLVKTLRAGMLYNGDIKDSKEVEDFIEKKIV